VGQKAADLTRQARAGLASLARGRHRLFIVGLHGFTSPKKEVSGPIVSIHVSGSSRTAPVSPRADPASMDIGPDQHDKADDEHTP
jgi:hypothetical protein